MSLLNQHSFNDVYISSLYVECTFKIKSRFLLYLGTVNFVTLKDREYKSEITCVAFARSRTHIS